MDIEHYEKFKRELESGLKKQASVSVRLFVESFQGESDIANWVWAYLPKLEKNGHSRIRHEIFINLVYPTLKKGFELGEYDSTLWLGKLIQNIYQTDGLFEELGSLVEMDFYKKCYEIDPNNNEGVSLLRSSILNWISYCEHEWPSGILYGADCATLEQCIIIKKEADFALSLTYTSDEKTYIERFLEKLSQYEKRLNKFKNESAHYVRTDGGKTRRPF